MAISSRRNDVTPYFVMNNLIETARKYVDKRSVFLCLTEGAMNKQAEAELCHAQFKDYSKIFSYSTYIPLTLASTQLSIYSVIFNLNIPYLPGGGELK